MYLCGNHISLDYFSIYFSRKQRVGYFNDCVQMSSKTLLLTLVVALVVLVSARSLGRLPALVLYRHLRSSRAYPGGIGGLRALSEDDDVVDSQEGLFPAPVEGEERHTVSPPSKSPPSKGKGSFDLFKESLFSALTSLFNSKEWKSNSMRPSNVVEGPVSSEGMPPFKKARRASEWVKDKERTSKPKTRRTSREQNKQENK